MDPSAKKGKGSSGSTISHLTNARYMPIRPAINTDSHILGEYGLRSSAPGARSPIFIPLHGQFLTQFQHSRQYLLESICSGFRNMGHFPAFLEPVKHSFVLQLSQM